ncbi:MAG: hypothetical protein Q8P18_20820 [Pseudomonadota bacterium]|nr:hypothetical protein [Pseudomonadota bacterium]
MVECPRAPRTATVHPEITPVREVDRRPVGTPGRITRNVREIHSAGVRGEIEWMRPLHHRHLMALLRSTPRGGPPTGAECNDVTLMVPRVDCSCVLLSAACRDTSTAVHSDPAVEFTEEAGERCATPDTGAPACPSSRRRGTLAPMTRRLAPLLAFPFLCAAAPGGSFPGAGPVVNAHLAPACIDRVGTEPIDFVQAYGGRERCALDAPALGTGFETFLRADDSLVLTEGRAPDGRRRIVAFRVGADGAARARALGSVPIDPTVTPLETDRARRHPQASVVLVPVHRMKPKAVTEVWAVLLDGGSPRKIASLERGSAQIWPLADGDAAVFEGLTGKPSRIVRARNGAVLATEVTDGDDVGGGFVRLHAAAGDSVLDLGTARVTAVPALPDDAGSVRALPDHALVFEVPIKATTSCGFDTSRIYRLPAPWTGPAEPLAEGAVSFSWRSDTGAVMYAQNARTSELAHIVTDLHDGKDAWAACGPKLDGIPGGWVEADLFRVANAGGAPEALGCGSLLGGAVFVPGCLDAAATRAAIARVPEPSEEPPRTVEAAAQLCWTALVHGNLPAWARCQGTGRPFPDLGSNSILGRVRYFQLREWALRAAPASPAPVVSPNGTVRFSAAGLPDLAMTFEQEDGAWQLADIRPAMY